MFFKNYFFSSLKIYIYINNLEILEIKLSNMNSRAPTFHSRYATGTTSKLSF